MAGTASKIRLTMLAGSETRQLVIEHNKLIDDIELIRANYATGTGVTAVAAAALLAAKIANLSGTVITATAG